MKLTKILRLATSIAFSLLVAGNAFAAQTNVAVAANFTEAAKEIAAAFQQKTGHEAVLSFGSSGQFYTQIMQCAPFRLRGRDPQIYVGMNISNGPVRVRGLATGR